MLFLIYLQGLQSGERRFRVLFQKINANIDGEGHVVIALWGKDWFPFVVRRVALKVGNKELNNAYVFNFQWNVNNIIGLLPALFGYIKIFTTFSPCTVLVTVLGIIFSAFKINWDKVFKSGPNKIKAVFHKFYLVHSWLLCPNCNFSKDQTWQYGSIRVQSFCSSVFIIYFEQVFAYWEDLHPAFTCLKWAMKIPEQIVKSDTRTTSLGLRML